MRPPARRTALSAAAVSALTLPVSGMHAVPGGVLGLDRQEGPRPHMQRDLVQADPALREPRHQRVGEMQAGGRRGDRALHAGEHGLVVGAIALVRLAP